MGAATATWLSSARAGTKARTDTAAIVAEAARRAIDRPSVGWGAVIRGCPSARPSAAARRRRRGSHRSRSGHTRRATVMVKPVSRSSETYTAYLTRISLTAPAFRGSRPDDATKAGCRTMALLLLLKDEPPPSTTTARRSRAASLVSRGSTSERRLHQGLVWSNAATTSSAAQTNLLFSGSTSEGNTTCPNAISERSTPAKTTDASATFFPCKF